MAAHTVKENTTAAVQVGHLQEARKTYQVQLKGLNVKTSNCKNRLRDSRQRIRNLGQIAKALSKFKMRKISRLKFRNYLKQICKH